MPPTVRSRERHSARARRAGSVMRAPYLYVPSSSALSRARLIQRTHLACALFFLSQRTRWDSRLINARALVGVANAIASLAALHCTQGWAALVQPSFPPCFTLHCTACKNPFSYCTLSVRY
jgi:hypothetical protein